jgi:hypothetical protein
MKCDHILQKVGVVRYSLQVIKTTAMSPKNSFRCEPF